MQKPSYYSYVSIDDIVDGKEKSPIDVTVFPNLMGINLCSVQGIACQRVDGQLTSMTVYFIPEFTSKDSDKFQ